MRDIKFRAWDIKKERMIPSVGVDPFHVNDLDRFYWKHEEVSLMQYTGLKDKNGKEIYEGDIVSFTVFDYNGSDKQYTGIVKFEELEFQIWKSVDSEYYGNDGAFSLFWVFNQDDEIEIIGNIYENPDLLKAGDSNV